MNKNDNERWVVVTAPSHFSLIDEVILREEYKPCAPENSIQPWSRVDKNLCARFKGVYRIPWAVVGTRNHIKALKW